MMNGHRFWGVCAALLLSATVMRAGVALDGGWGIALAGEIPPGEVATSSNTAPATPSDAAPDEIILLMDLPEAGCSTPEELEEQLLDENCDTIRLTEDIVWTQDWGIPVSEDKEVEMGDYSIYVGAEASFDVSGPVTFTGRGTDAPLFVVEGGFGAGDGVQVQATGDHAVAIAVSGGRWTAVETEVFADGTDAVAVRFSGAQEQTMELCRIQAQGRGSRGIETEGPLRLVLSAVSGSESAVNSVSGELTVFGSSLSPEAECGEEIPLLVVPGERLEENGICIPVGSSPSELWSVMEDYEKISWTFFPESGEFNVSYVFPGAWSELPTDFSEPGTHMASFFTKELPEWFPVDLYRRAVPIHTVDPGRPFIMDAWDAGAAVLLRFFAPIQGASELRVEYSMDDGVSWMDAMTLPNSFVTESVASIELPVPDRDYRFRLVVKGGPMEGSSNEILFVGDAIRKANGGGDRDHGDRDDQGEEPPHGEIIPPPDTDTPDGDSSDGGASGTTPPDGDSSDGGASGTTPPDGDSSDGGASGTTSPGKGTSDGNAANTAALAGEAPDQHSPDAIITETEIVTEAQTEADSLLSSEPSEPSGSDGRRHRQKSESPQTITQESLATTQNESRFSLSGYGSWLLLAGGILLGGSAYAGWKKHTKKH